MGYNNRLSAYCFECFDFIKENLGRFLSFAIFALIGIGVGIWYGVVVSSEIVYFWHFQNRIFLLITGEASFVKYLFLILIECIILIGIIILLSLHYYMTFFSYLIFIYKGYVIAFNTVILIAIAKLSCLPFILLCYLPFSLFLITCLIFIASKSACDSSFSLYANFRLPLKETLFPLAPVLLIIFIISFLESILSFILTSGIVI